MNTAIINTIILLLLYYRFISKYTLWRRGPMDIKEWRYPLLVWICLCMTVTTLPIYILPSNSPSTPCHHAFPCLTLSQFATNSTLIYVSNTSLIFLPGNHSLDVVMSVTNVTELTMLSLSSTSNSLSSITCQQDASLTFIKIGQVLIQDLMFVGCGNNKIAKIRNFTIKNSNFYGHNGTKTALVMEETLCVITNSSFVSFTEGRPYH